MIAVDSFSWRSGKPIMVLVTAIISMPMYLGLISETSRTEPPLQTLPMHRISLQDKEAFRHPGSNWIIAGGVKSNRLQSKDLHAVPGEGVLVNNPTPGDNTNGVTRMKHGDLELELDFLMPKDSNSGIYLQGRYEVQLFDSWGIKNPSYGDCGGIYERWDSAKPKGRRGYGGHAPLMNASRAPGLWQHLKVIFKAPVFDSRGHKTSNAKFKKVWINGVLVQKDVTVTGPTRSAIYKDEKPMGPLVIQGDHGPVAIRNIQYKKYDKNRIRLKNIHFNFYQGAFAAIPYIDTLTADTTGQVDSLVADVGKDAERYFLHYAGTLDAPNTGKYLFKVQQAGMAQLTIDGQEVINQTHFYTMDQYDAGTITLDKGEHRFEFNYFNHPISWLHGLALYGEGPQLRMQPFHSVNSLPNKGRDFPPLLVPPAQRVKAIRSFGMFGSMERTNVINVGSPAGINYNYDIGQGEVLHIWNGPFIDAKQMWDSRGESQLATLVGSVIKMDGKPPLAHLESDSQAWPDSVAWDDMQILGYDLRKDGWPEFKYKIGDISVRDYLHGSAGNRRIIRKIQLQAPEKERGCWFHLAAGEAIRKNANNEYVIDDRLYYLKILDSGGTTPVIHDTREGQELLMPALSADAKTTIRYALIW